MLEPVDGFLVKNALILKYIIFSDEKKQKRPRLMRRILLQMRYNVVSTVVMILLYQRPRNFIFARCAAAPGPERIFRCLIAAVSRAAHMRVYTYTHVYVVSNGTETPKNRFADSG